MRFPQDVADLHASVSLVESSVSTEQVPVVGEPGMADCEAEWWNGDG